MLHRHRSRWMIANCSTVLKAGAWPALCVHNSGFTGRIERPWLAALHLSKWLAQPPCIQTSELLHPLTYTTLTYTTTLPEARAQDMMRPKSGSRLVLGSIYVVSPIMLSLKIVFHRRGLASLCAQPFSDVLAKRCHPRPTFWLRQASTHTASQTLLRNSSLRTRLIRSATIALTSGTIGYLFMKHALPYQYQVESSYEVGDPNDKLYRKLVEWFLNTDPLIDQVASTKEDVVELPPSILGHGDDPDNACPAGTKRGNRFISQLSKGSRGIYSRVFTQRDAAYPVYMFTCTGWGTEGFEPLKDSTGLITALMCEAANILARGCLGPNKTYGLASLSTWCAADDLGKKSRPYQIFAYPAMWFAGDPDVRQLLADRLETGNGDPFWDAPELRRTVVVIVKSRSILRPKAEDMKHGQIYALAVVKFDIDDQGRLAGNMLHERVKERDA